MSNSNDYYIDLDESAEKLLKEAKYLGKGHNGIVYLLPKNRIIKIFKELKVCKDEYSILSNVGENKYFPNVYKRGDFYIVRDYVGGKRLDHYLKIHGLDRTISINIIEMIENFIKIGFTRLDIRCKDIYVQEDKSLIIIDPKNNFKKIVNYPRHLMKGLNKIGVLDNFLQVVKEERPCYYEYWNFKIKKYLKHNIK